MLAKNVVIYGISGRATSGKDTLAEILSEHLVNKGYSVLTLSFADIIKDMLIKTFGFTHEQMYDQKEKHKVDPYWGITPRELLQKVGTDMFRNQWRLDVWTKCFMRRVQEHAKYMAANQKLIVIVPDVRYPIEADTIALFPNYMMIRIQRSSVENRYYETYRRNAFRLNMQQMFPRLKRFFPIRFEDQTILHDSERHIDEIMIDRTLKNDYATLEDYQKACRSFAESIEFICE